MDKVSIPKYTLGEELFNSISHGCAAGLAVAALVLLIIRAHSAMGVVTGVIYATIMIVLYVISCIYHSLSPRLLGKKVLRIIDHDNVLLMVAGTYTPICLCLFGDLLGWVMFSIVWIVTIIAIILNSINIDKYQKVCLGCNLGLGWASLLIIKQLLEVCPVNGLILLILGGVVYSIGAILYGLGRKIRYMHSIFHLFIIAASIFHFFFIYFYVI